MDSSIQRIADIAAEALNGRAASRSDAEFLVSIGNDLLEDLFYWANRIRLRWCGPEIYLCSIIPARFGGCSEDCKFCAQSARYQTQTGVRQVAADEMVSAARKAHEQCQSSCFGIVTSGRGIPSTQFDDIENAIRQIQSEGRVNSCASLGLLTEQQAQRLAKAGLRRYNHNLETGKRFYPHLVTTHKYEDRLNTLKIARKAGLQLCAGGIFGVGESWDDRLDLAFEIQSLSPEIVPLNFLLPIPGTPLEGSASLPALEILKIIAVFRFAAIKTRINIAGGRERGLRDLQSWIFRAGANGMLIGNLLATCGRAPEADLQMLKDLNLPVAARDQGIARGGE